MTTIGTERRCVCGEMVLFCPPPHRPGGLPMHDGRRPAMAALADAMGHWEEREHFGKVHVCGLAGVVEALSTKPQEPHAEDYIPERSHGAAQQPQPEPPRREAGRPAVSGAAPATGVRPAGGNETQRQGPRPLKGSIDI
jgi:hypothetical protein